MSVRGWAGAHEPTEPDNEVRRAVAAAGRRRAHSPLRRRRQRNRRIRPGGRRSPAVASTPPHPMSAGASVRTAIPVAVDSDTWERRDAAAAHRPSARRPLRSKVREVCAVPTTSQRCDGWQRAWRVSVRTARNRKRSYTDTGAVRCSAVRLRGRRRAGRSKQRPIDAAETAGVQMRHTRVEEQQKHGSDTTTAHRTAAPPLCGRPRRTANKHSTINSSTQRMGIKQNACGYMHALN